MLAFLFSPVGRIGRAQWWLAQLVPMSFFIVLFVLVAQSEPNLGWLNGVGCSVVCIFLVWLSFCVTVKRYHDRNKSGWWYLLQFVPIVGPIWAMVELGFLPGDYADNDFGTGPGFDIEDDIKRLKAASHPGNIMQGMTGPVPSTGQPPQVDQGSRRSTPSFGKRT
jgi:uncharacterized membrane protein YhaH (DUF805 family)